MIEESEGTVNLGKPNPALKNTFKADVRKGIYDAVPLVMIGYCTIVARVWVQLQKNLRRNTMGEPGTNLFHARPVTGTAPIEAPIAACTKAKAGPYSSETTLPRRA